MGHAGRARGSHVKQAERYAEQQRRNDLFSVEHQQIDFVRAVGFVDVHFNGGTFDVVSTKTRRVLDTRNREASAIAHAHYVSELARDAELTPSMLLEIRVPDAARLVWLELQGLEIHRAEVFWTSRHMETLETYIDHCLSKAAAIYRTVQARIDELTPSNPH